MKIYNNTSKTTYKVLIHYICAPNQTCMKNVTLWKILLFVISLPVLITISQSCKKDKLSTNSRLDE
jgi:magnesium-transporting ATPase (P-type)